MIFPRKKLILPCHKNGYLQSASDAHKWRDRFKRNPLAKVADMFIPKPLRMSPGYPCCCGGEVPEPTGTCLCSANGDPLVMTAVVEGVTGSGTCTNWNASWILPLFSSTQQTSGLQGDYCCWNYLRGYTCSDGYNEISQFPVVQTRHYGDNIWMRFVWNLSGKLIYGSLNTDDGLIDDCSVDNVLPLTESAIGECDASASACTVSASYE